MILLRQRFYSDNNSDDNKKSNKAAKEAGMIAGSLGVGALGGVSIHKLAKDLDPGLVGRQDRMIKKNWDKYYKAVDKQNRKMKKSPEKATELRQKLDKELAKTAEKNSKINSRFGKLRKVSEPISKFAKTKGGKWTLIGVPAAALSTGAYLEAKKKDKQ